MLRADSPGYQINSGCLAPCAFHSLIYGKEFYRTMEQDNSFIVRCPRCGKEAPVKGNPYRPFCSQRCKLIDLGKWADEEYLIPAQDDETETEAEPEKE